MSALAKEHALHDEGWSTKGTFSLPFSLTCEAHGVPECSKGVALLLMPRVTHKHLLKNSVVHSMPGR